MTDHPNLTATPVPAGLLDPQGATTIAARTCLLEGPAFDAAGNLFFSDIGGNRIYRLTPAGHLSIFRSDSGRTNGNTFDALGRLISCEGAEFSPGGRRRVVMTDITTGGVEVLTDSYEGKRYNSPNDVVVDTKGRIWFTDPYYAEDRSILEMDEEAVYRIDPDATVTRVLSQPSIERPNGLVITSDARTLYVIDSHGRPGGNRKVWAFDVDEDGDLSGQRLVFDFGRGRGGDGMRLDLRGNLWVAAGILFPRHAGETDEVPPGVYVITPRGELLGRIPIPEDLCTNLAFGGPDRKTLYVTAGKTVWKVPLAVAGYALYPPAGEV
jgi:gluconolactonase